MAADYNALVYTEQGGSRGVVASGGSFDVESGGEIDVESGGSLKLAGTAITSTAAELNILDGVTADASEINVLDGVTAGTVTASKAVVVDANKKIDTIDINDAGGLKLAGTAVTSTAAELNILDGVTATATELNLLDLSAVGALTKIKKLSISATPDGTEQDTAFDLPTKALVLEVFVDVTTAEATGTTKTLDVGLLSSETNGDADGFVDGISVSSTGVKRAVPLTTSGANETYMGATQEIGALFRGAFVAGSDTAGDHGLLVLRPHVIDTAVSVTYTAGSNDWAEFRGDIYVVYIEIA